MPQENSKPSAVQTKIAMIELRKVFLTSLLTISLSNSAKAYGLEDSIATGVGQALALYFFPLLFYPFIPNPEVEFLWVPPNAKPKNEHFELGDRESRFSLLWNQQIPVSGYAYATSGNILQIVVEIKNVLNVPIEISGEKSFFTSGKPPYGEFSSGSFTMLSESCPVDPFADCQKQYEVKSINIYAGEKVKLNFSMGVAIRSGVREIPIQNLELRLKKMTIAGKDIYDFQTIPLVRFPYKGKKISFSLFQ